MTFDYKQKEELKNVIRAGLAARDSAETLESVMSHLENAPALKSAGYASDYGGMNDPSHKSLGDFLLAIQRNDVRRLRGVYKSRLDTETHLKDIQYSDGPAGGYLVPESYVPQLMMAAAENSIVRPRATVFPVVTGQGKIPSLDLATGVTGGQGDTNLAGGITLEWTAAGGAITETEPLFQQVEYNLRKLAGYTEVENEVVADSPLVIEAILSQLFGMAIAAKEDYAFLRGTGANEPLGVLNAACAIAVTTTADNTFGILDATAMLARFKSFGGRPVWVMHPGVTPDLGASGFEIGTGGSVFMADQSRDIIGLPLLGYGVYRSEHLPQDDNSGDVILADFKAYCIFDKSPGGMSIAFSEHAAFTTDKGTWRVTKRVDGQPWLSSAVTLADPQGSYTVSPFTYHDD